MPEPTGQNISVYFSAETMPKFEVVKRHIGKGNSGTITHLVEDKYNDIDEGKTRRHQIELMREEQSAMRAEIAELKRMIEELKHDPTDYTDHA